MVRTETTTDAPLDGTRSLSVRAASLDVSTANGEPSEPGSSPDGVASALRHERFQIGARLGEGGMGIVYRARDNRNGREVALKLMKGTLSGAARRRFEREFQSLSALRHPYCLGVYDYGELGGGPFFTMELFLGQPITSLSARPLPDRLDALLQLTHALDYIHGHGIVHRDVKPSNILVRPATRDDGPRHFETRLMDFGLAKYYGVKSSLSAEAGFVGTVAYCAPEQINLDELDHRADLYCMGLVAYELLCGCYAFPEARLAGMRPLMQAQLNDKPRALSSQNPEVPGAIADAVMKYLRKPTRRRPDSAGLLRSAIAESLGVDVVSMVSGASIPLVRPTLSVTGFVCRADEQEMLEDVVRRCLRPSSCVGDMPAPLIVISGEPGIGKSSLVQEAERLARGHGCQVYEGRCFDGNLSPFQPFVEIIRQLIAELKLQERREAAATDEDLTGTHVAGLPLESLARLLGIVNDYRGELLRIVPELRKYLPGEAYQQVDHGREADYIYRALAGFFVEVSKVQPICLSFEDLQWADKSSLDLLRHLAAALAVARRSADDGPRMSRLVILGSARTGFALLESILNQLREHRHLLELRLVPLTESETRELIALRMNCRPEELADDLVGRVHALCGGNPFFIAETVRDWYDKQAIARNETGWVLSTQATDSSDLPETVRDVMRLRLQGLPAKAQQVLGAAAVVGAVVDVDLLRDVLPELTEADVLDALDLLLPRRVFRETGNPGQVEFVHDLLHEIPYADLSAARRRSLHRRVGELLESRRAGGQAVPPAVLADHFRGSDDASKCFRYTMEAAEAALDAYAFNNAITHLKEALKVCPADADDAAHFRLWDMLGAANASSGRLDEAIVAFSEALKHANDALRRASAHHGIGEAYHHKGATDEATHHLDLALRELGYPRPGSTPGRLLDLWRAALVVHALPAGFRLPWHGRDHDLRLRRACAVYTCLLQVTGMWSVFQYFHGSYRFASFAMRTNDPELLHFAYSKFSLNTGMFSMSVLSGHYLRRADRAARSCQSPHLVAMARAHVGVAHYFAGRLPEAEAELRAAAPTLDKVGEWFGVFTHHTLRHIYGVRASNAPELAEAEWEIATGTARGDQATTAWGQYGKAHALARMGRFPEAVELATAAVSSSIARKLRNIVGIAYGTLSFARLQASDYPGAREAAEQARAASFRALCVFEYVGLTFPLLVESLLGPLWAEPGRGPSRSVARRAWRESRFARFIGWRYPNYRAHCLRVSGRAAFAMGKTRKAANYLERAIAEAERLGARYDLARAYLDAARIIPEESEEFRRRGRQLLDELGAVIPEAERDLDVAAG